jgi:hypothetical protein
VNPRALALIPLLTAACAVPSVDVAPTAGDFAFVEIQLQG